MIDVKAQIEALNADVDAMLAAQAAEPRGARATSRSATSRSTWRPPSSRRRADEADAEADDAADAAEEGTEDSKA